MHDDETYATGGRVSTGIYSCSVAITAAATPLETIFDVWHKSGVEYFTGSVTPAEVRGSEVVTEPTYYMNITKLKR